MRSLARIVVPLLACAVLVETSGATTSSPQLLAHIKTRVSKPCGSAVYGKYLYVANYGSGTLVRINPRTNKAVKTIHVGDGTCGVFAVPARSGSRTSAAAISSGSRIRIERSR